MGDQSGTPFGRVMHPPIDRILLRNLARSKRSSQEREPIQRIINWTQLTENEYYDLVARLREAIPDNQPFWQIEEYSQPSEPEEELSH